MKKSKNNFVIYTALFGDYDELKHPLTENTCNYDFVCFTNQKDIKSDIWQIRFVEEANYLPNIANRKYKMLPHLFLKDYEESIYIDANVIPKGNIAKFREEYLKDWDVVLPSHFKRECLYDEALEVIRLGLAEKNLVLEQIKSYEMDGFPRNFGLTENNIIYRKHMKSNVIKLMEDWWKEYLRFPTRDQLSLMYIIWKKQLEGKRINMRIIENLRGSKYFYLTLHKKNKRNGIIALIKNKLSEYKINHPESNLIRFYRKFSKILSTFKYAFHNEKRVGKNRK